MALPADYLERVYAGVLGKTIGVYLGRPFEQWSHERIIAELGEIDYFVNDRLHVPLVVTDDDLSGTFTFIRSLEDHDAGIDITSGQIGDSWLNYIVEKRAILWWSGFGLSTEHTAFLRLKQGMRAPQSGSAAVNGKVVSEEIGSQIFIDGWAMVAPGDPQQAAELARKAAAVSHDGEAIYGAQVIAALESLAFVESDLQVLLDVAVSLIPQDSAVFAMIDDLRNVRSKGVDWRTALSHIHSRYSYEIVGGCCPILSNDAVIMLGLLWGDDDFQRSLMITNTAGYDTDCNSGNVGCLLGIKNGLAALDAGPDWRGPIADRLLLPTADGGNCVTDTVTQAYRIGNTGRSLAGQPAVLPKGGARFHFEMPGAVQGFHVDGSPIGGVELKNVLGHSASGSRSLAVRSHGDTRSRTLRVMTPTWITVEQSKMTPYEALACPTLYSGNTITARVEVDAGNAGPVDARLCLAVYDENDTLVRMAGPTKTLHADHGEMLEWKIPSTGAQPIAAVGLELTPRTQGDGIVYLDWLSWDGTPEVVLQKPPRGGSLWQKAWIDATDQQAPHWLANTVIQNEGRGLFYQGTRQWNNYELQVDLEAHLATAFGPAFYIQGLRRYFAVLLTDRTHVSLVKMLNDESVIERRPFDWSFGRPYRFTIRISGNHIEASVDGKVIFEYVDRAPVLAGGAVGVVCEQGRCRYGPVRITPLGRV